MPRKYCFIPDCNKIVKIYNTGLISEDSAPPNNNIDDIKPSIVLNVAIDKNDKAELFYIDSKKEDEIIADKDYFIRNTIQNIKKIFGASIEICNYEISLNEKNPHIKFILWYDIDGINIPVSELSKKNKSNTILSHCYTYHFYQNYYNEKSSDI
jgi:hypothetical protein